MRKYLIPLCLVAGSFMVNGQRSYQFGSAERLFIEGKELFSLKNYPGCMDKLEAWKQQQAVTDPELLQEADYMLVYAAFEQGYEESVLLLNDFLEKYPDSRHTNEIYFLIGSAYFASEDYSEALHFLQESNIDHLSPWQQEEYSFRLAYSLLQEDRVEEARSYFSRIAQIGSRYKEASGYYVAYIDYATGDYPNALIAFSHLREHPEYRQQSLYYIAQINFIEGKYDRVIREGEELLSAYPDSENNEEVYRIVGNSYYHTGNQEKAIDYLSKYVHVAARPLRGDVYILGVCYFNRGEYQKVVDVMGGVLQQDDELAQSANLYLGQSYLKLNDKNRARLAFEAAAKSSYDKEIKEVATYNYALIIHETSFTGFGESVTIFENFLNDFPRSKYSDKVNDYLVEVYLTTKNYQAALTSIEKIKNPSNRILEAKQAILFQLGTQSFANVRMPEAIDYFNRAISLGNYNPVARTDAYFWRGESYYRTGEYNKAISDYQAYLNNTRQRSSEMYALAYYSMGYSYFKLQKYNEALSRFRQYLEQEKDKTSAAYADAYNRIGDCYFHNRQFAQAEQNYTRAAEVRPSAGDYAVYQKGYVLGLQKDYRGKINMMDQLIREFPESQYVDDALYEKGRSYVLLENYPQAAQAFESLINRFPQSSLARKAGIQLGLLYFNDNQPQKSVDAYKHVIKNYPGSEEAKVAIQDLKSVYIELNDINAYAAYVNSLGGSMKLEASEQDSLTYIAAEKLFMREQNEEARRSLVNYLQTYPQGAFSANANFYLATIAFNQKNYNDAKRYYTIAIESGDTKFLEESVARVAEIQYLEKEYTAALESFKRLEIVAENPDNRLAAKLGIMRTARATGKQQDALIAAEGLLKQDKLSPEVETEARYVRAKAYLNANEGNKAVADLLAVSSDTRTVYGAEAKYLLAQYYYDTSEDAKAEEILMNFIENGTPHQYWLARGFILLADVYIRQGDSFQARQYLNSLQNNYSGDDDIAAMIQNRLNKLND
ncbi:MAG: tetratricopeptide repeat protein [Tannerellaceae bacterium]|nr:tetratricopeptide repeat protein [Tannerellaceae bacterium]